MDNNLRQIQNWHAETQNNFRQASNALEAAYRRIRQLRHSLLELAESMPTPDSQAPAPGPNDVGPAHDAILLSSPVNPDEQEDPLVLDMSALLPPSFTERLELPEERSDHPRESTTPPPAPTGRATRPLPSRSPLFNLNSPNLPVRNSLPPPRRSFLESQLTRRRDLNPDDPSTALGRRVAAREAGEILTDPQLPQLERFLVTTTALLARNLESLSNRLNQRFQTIDSSVPSRTDLTAPNQGLTPAEHRPRRTADTSNARGARSLSVNTTQTSPNPSMFPPRPPPNRRWRALIRPESGGRQTTGPVSGQSSSNTRLSLLSNFSAVENFPSPLTPSSRERPILFEEPYSYAPPNQPSDTRFEDDVEMNSAERGYVVRRMVNADGDELVHTFNLLWNDPEDDRASSWLPPQQDSQAHRNAHVPIREPYLRTETHARASSNNAPAPETPRRRRGWGNSFPILPYSISLTQVIISTFGRRRQRDIYRRRRRVGACSSRISNSSLAQPISRHTIFANRPGSRKYTRTSDGVSIRTYNTKYYISGTGRAGCGTCTNKRYREKSDGECTRFYASIGQSQAFSSDKHKFPGAIVHGGNISIRKSGDIRVARSIRCRPSSNAFVYDASRL
jgi:hypothetical protein